MSEAAEKVQDSADEVSMDELANMSDEEIAQLDPGSLEDSTQEESAEVPEEETGTDDFTEEEKSTKSEDTDEEEEESSESDDRNVFSTDTDTGSQEPAEETADTAETTEINYQQEYEKLLEPFKAAKREIRVQSVDDARKLMQMGVDYSRKMEEMKPYNTILKTLEKNDLLDREKINFLIDLDKKNPDAIKKFMKDAEVDPMEVAYDDDDSAKNYQPKNYQVDPKELALDEVLDEIRDTESFSRTVDELTNRWDQTSKDVLLDNPRLIKTINQHVEVGIYDQIMNVVEQERLFGRLNGLTDLQAYKAVGDAIEAKGGFKPYQQQQTSVTEKPSGTDSRKANEETARRKRAASPTKGNSAKNTAKSVNFLGSMTDEEIENMDPGSVI